MRVASLTSGGWRYARNDAPRHSGSSRQPTAAAAGHGHPARLVDPELSAHSPSTLRIGVPGPLTSGYDVCSCWQLRASSGRSADSLRTDVTIP
jgi:hypothetical protein